MVLIHDGNALLNTGGTAAARHGSSARVAAGLCGLSAPASAPQSDRINSP
jgi:hypothetical protein